ncbi:hypothetical protein QBC39DRAFT_75763 [Podospora conica]|nr:hypothetical protein QBC39DRAFT_75763 [Schizothecium conicum]
MAQSLVPPACRGKIVALEGPSDLVTTQLRLLPTSSQILILPGIQRYLPDGDEEPPTSTKEFIYKVHMASRARHTAAVSFLQEAAHDKKRVVFMDGGTVGARVLCVSAIAYNQTAGDIEKADEIYEKLTSDGIAGLLDDRRTSDMGLGGGSSDAKPPSLRSKTDTASSNRVSVMSKGSISEDPIVRAMRAADALDRRTENLQSPNNEVDVSACWFNNTKTWSGSRPRLPSMTFGGPVAGSMSSCALGNGGDPRSLLSSVEDLSSSEIDSATVCSRPLETHIPSSTLSWVDEACEVTNSPRSQQLAPPVEPPATRPKRCESTESDGFNFAFESPSTALQPPVRKRPPRLNLVIDPGQKKNLPAIAPPTEFAPSNSSLNLSVVRLDETSATPPLSACRQPPRKASAYPESYVDKATDTAGLSYDDSASVYSTPTPPVEEVLPLLEDLVIYLAGEAHNEVFERIFQGFRNGTIRINETASDGSGQAPMSPTGTTSQTTDLAAVSSPSDTISSRDTIGQLPFQGGGECSFLYDISRESRLPTPPYDLYKPPTPKLGPDQRFQTLSVRRQTEVSTQNTLRLILSSYIPSEVWTQQPTRALNPLGKGTLWKPVLWGNKPAGKWQPCRELDMILAIGSERSVRKSYTSAVIDQIEKLGSKVDVSRSGRLDLRYLIANAMQAFTCQPLTQQTGDNPFADSTSLANLVIPHLEAYLASHPEVRFLVLEFTPDHLGTVLAIRRIVGTSTLKIAAIIGSDNPSSLAPSSTSSTSDPDKFIELRSVGGLDAFSNSVSPKASHIPAHRVNYVLPFSATHSEIAAFIAAIHSTLCATSSFYTTDPSLPTNPPNTKATFLLSSASTSLDTPPASPLHSRTSTYSPPIPPRTARSTSSAAPSTPVDAFSRFSVSTFDRAVGRGAMLASPTSVSSASHYQADNASASGPYFSAIGVQTSSRSDSGSESSSRRKAMWGKTPRQQRRGRVSGTWGVTVVRGSLLEEEEEGEEEISEVGGEGESIVEEEEDEEYDDVDERRLMPMYMARRRREKEREKGESGKAMRLLGLA